MARSLRSVLQFFVNLLSRLRKWLNKIGSPFRINRRFVRNLDSLARSGKTQGGFVLPVVALVTTAVTLLVVVTVSRSADRAQNAANNRVQEAFRSANTPIIDRGRLKIAKLISDTEQQQRTTPSDTLLNTVFQGTDFTLPDEIRLQINTEFDGTSGFKYTATTIADNEVSNTAWKFPIDTDGNGRFDTFGLYSIQFRAKPVTGAYLNRAVSPLESRSKPMEAGTLSGNCAGAAANVATNEGWESGTDGKLRKAFFVYATTIPITTLPTAAEIGGSTSTPSGNIANYEVFRGSRVFSALELQQDRLRTPLNNNAVWFEGDVELARAATFRLNGRVYSGGNLMIGSLTGNPITFYQVSASNNDADASNGTDAGSCYYSEDNSVVIVAGNTVEGDALSTDTSLGGADFHLFLKDNANPLSNTSLGVATLNDSTQSVISAANNRGADVLFNELELTRRVFRLVNQVLTVASPSGALYTGTTPVTIPAAPAVVSYQNVAYDDPYTVKVSTAKRIVDEGLSTKAEFDLARRSAYEQYFRDRLRKVPSIEVGFSAAVTKLNSTPALSGDPTSILARQTVTNPDGTTGYEWLPPVEWLIPFDGNGASLNRSVSSYTTGGTRYNGRGLLSLSTSAGGTAPTATITLNVNSSTKLANPPAVDPKDAATRKNTYLGDRILVGNNLPARWPYFDADGKFSYIDASKQQTYAFGVASNAVFWNSPTNIATATTSERTRTTQAYTLESLGVSDRNGFWELSATANPADPNPLPAANQVNTVANSTPTTGGLRVVVNSGIYTKLTPAEMGSVRTVDAPGTFLPPYHTGVSDDPATTTIDESAAPMYDSNLEDSFGNLIDTRRFAAPDNSATTTTDESKTQNFVVWPDSMPLSPEIRWLSAATTPAVAAANAGYYRIKPAVNDLTQYSSYTNNNGATIDSTTTTQIPLTADNIPRGNLQMRAAAVYHYKYDSFNANALTQSDYQRPVACVSSYYDNSFSYLENPFAAPSTTNSRISTAFNRSGARWNDGSATGVFGKGGLSNNGIVYTPVTHAGNMPALASGIVYNAATGLFSGYADGARNPADGNIAFGDRLAYQANLIFPNGRLVNEPLRKVLLKMLGDGTTSNPLNNRNPALAKLTIAEQSTLDANLCALQIMQSSGSSGSPLTATTANTVGTGGAADVAPNAVNGAKLPHGAIKESAFLDGREVQSLNRNETMYHSSPAVPVTCTVIACSLHCVLLHHCIAASRRISTIKRKSHHHATTNNDSTVVARSPLAALTPH
ncbi:MAG: hormogonium polysaccharide biosynthesis protein HpsA [Pseudanabaenaceae cyanobacterium]